MDNYFEELKESEMLTKRITVADQIQEFVGKYYSHDLVRRNVLRQNDKDIEENDKQIAEEQNNPIYNPPLPEAPGQDQGGAPDEAQPPGAPGEAPAGAQPQGGAVPSIDKFPATDTNK
jgi:hypothetical protein